MGDNDDQSSSSENGDSGGMSDDPGSIGAKSSPSEEVQSRDSDSGSEE